MKHNPESNCCEHGIQWMTPSICYRCLREENAELQAKLARVETLAAEGQNRDALHAFDALLRIERLATTKGGKR